MTFFRDRRGIECWVGRQQLAVWSRTLASGMEVFSVHAIVALPKRIPRALRPNADVPLAVLIERR